jgi:hypothetical protein
MPPRMQRLCRSHRNIAASVAPSAGDADSVQTGILAWDVRAQGRFRRRRSFARILPRGTRATSFSGRDRRDWCTRTVVGSFCRGGGLPRLYRITFEAPDNYRPLRMQTWKRRNRSRQSSVPSFARTRSPVKIFSNSSGAPCGSLIVASPHACSSGGTGFPPIKV